MLWINEINRIFQEAPILEISGWSELQNAGFQICVNLETKQILEMQGFSDFEFANLLWKVGVLPLEETEELRRLDAYLDRKAIRPKGIAIDSNIILNRFLINYRKQRLNTVSARFQAIIVAAEASSHEFHYKAGFTLAQDLQTLTQLFNLIKNTPLQCQLLTNANQPNVVRDRLKLVKSYEGRLGIKGQLEIRQFQKEIPVLLVQSMHPYYASPFQANRNVDALFDSLIRIEVGYIAKITNMELIFLTSDKDQSESAITEGLQCIYITRPSKWTELLDPAPRFITIENISLLLFELLFVSPFLCIKAGTFEAYYSFFWHNKQSEANLETKIRKITATSPIDYLTLV